MRAREAEILCDRCLQFRKRINESTENTSGDPACQPHQHTQACAKGVHQTDSECVIIS